MVWRRGAARFSIEAREVAARGAAGHLAVVIDVEAAVVVKGRLPGGGRHGDRRIRRRLGHQRRGWGGWRWALLTCTSAAWGPVARAQTPGKILKQLAVCGANRKQLQTARINERKRSGRRGLCSMQCTQRHIPAGALSLRFELGQLDFIVVEYMVVPLA